LTIMSFLLYFLCLQTCKLLIKRLCFNIIFGISSIFVCTENIIKFRPTSPSKGEVLPCLGFWFLGMSGMFALHCLSCHILFMPCIMFEEPFILSLYFSLVSLRIFCRFFFGMTVKSMSGGCFSVLVFLNLPEDRFALTYMFCLDICSFPFKHVFVVFVFNFSTKKILGEKMQNFILFYIAFQILYVFLPDNSVHCALIEYAYIWLRVYV